MSRIPIANIYYLLCYGWRHAEEGEVVEVKQLEQLDAVQDLWAKVLALGVFRLLRRGLDRGYKEVHEDLAGVRGKINVGDMAKRALRVQGKVACVYEELSHDIVHNQILRSTLRNLLRISDLNRKVRSDVFMAYNRLPGISEISMSRHVFQKVKLDRNNRFYRFLMSVCRLIYDQLLVDDDAGQTKFQDISEKQLHRLFEDFAIGFYKQEQQRYTVNKHGRTIKWNLCGPAPDELPKMEADVILESPDRRIIMDTKFYGKTLGSKSFNKDDRDGGVRGKLHSPNLYQLLAYLRNREATCPDGAKHDGILLYPRVDQSVDVSVCLEGFNIRVRTIDLAQHWKNIHDEMLDVISLENECARVYA